uniref:TSC22 domain family protein 4 n=1 Tax=Pogona vitticeps TaxID=103695 RepID=A0ABM5EJP1_9SAUR
MSGGKKKSGFQITSVTSDYEQRDGPGDAKAPPGSPRVARGAGPGEEAEAAGEEEGGGGGGGPPKRAPGGPAPNGPTPGPLGGGGVAVPVAGSRFRVVKLDPGPGEPYKRGRWTCRDFYEPEPEASPAGRLADPARQPQSLDSRLEVAGLLAKPPQPPAPFSPQPPRRGAPAPQARLLLPGAAAAAPAASPSGGQARSLGGGLPGLLRPPAAPPSPATLRSPLAAPPDAPPRAPAAREPGSSSSDAAAPAPLLPALVVVDEPRLPRSVAQLIRREGDEPRRKVSSPRQSRSRPSSPAPPLFRDASPSRRTSDPFGAARFSLAQSMFGMGVGPHDSDDDSGTNSSLIAIDNKIEQAMDLVKSHLMFAVREEVEVLRDQIKELSERNALLEQENALLRSLANAEQLSHFQAQLHAAKPPSSGSTA